MDPGLAPCPHEAEVKVIRQSNNPRVRRPLPHLLDHLKHTTGVLAGFDDQQGCTGRTVLEALWPCDRSSLGNRKRRVLQHLLKPRTEQRAVAEQSRGDGWSQA